MQISLKGIVFVGFLALLMLGGIFFFQYSRFNDGLLHIVVCNVGQGDGVYIRTPKGRDIIFDGGPDNSILSCLSKHMPFWDRQIELMLLSHPHADHLNGLISVIKRYSVTHYATERLSNDTAGYRELISEINQSSINCYSKSTLKLTNIKSEDQESYLKWEVRNERVDNEVGSEKLGLRFLTGKILGQALAATDIKAKSVLNGDVVDSGQVIRSQDSQDSGTRMTNRLLPPDQVRGRNDEEGKMLNQVQHDDGQAEVTSKCGEIKYLYAGDKVNFNKDISLKVLAPTKFSLEKASPNGLIGDTSEFSSLVLLLSYGSFDMLLTGDSQTEALGEAIAQGLDSRFRGNDREGRGNDGLEVLQVPHHGSKTGLNSNLLYQINPKLAVISIGRKNKYGHPSKEVLSALKDHKVKFLRTDEKGEIEIVSDGKKWWVK